MYRLARVLTQSKKECTITPGRVVKVYYNYFSKQYCGVKYNSCGCEIYTPMVPDFEFELID